MTHPATQPNGECSIAECPCHELAQSQPQQLTVAAVRRALFDVLDAGDYTEANSQVGISWVFFIHDESDAETTRRVRFVDAVVERLKEMTNA